MKNTKVLKLIKKLLGLSLKDKSFSLKKKYKSNRQLFDYTQVKIILNESGDKFNYYANCFCRDVLAQGLSNSSSITIFRSKKFKTQIEAEADLEKEVRYTLKKLKDTNFYLYKKIRYFGEKEVLDDVYANHKYSSSGWEIVDDLPNHPY